MAHSLAKNAYTSTLRIHTIYRFYHRILIKFSILILHSARAYYIYSIYDYLIISDSLLI